MVYQRKGKPTLGQSPIFHTPCSCLPHEGVVKAKRRISVQTDALREEKVKEKGTREKKDRAFKLLT
jgi:hypothetical protein